MFAYPWKPDLGNTRKAVYGDVCVVHVKEKSLSVETERLSLMPFAKEKGGDDRHTHTVEEATHARTHGKCSFIK